MVTSQKNVNFAAEIQTKKPKNKMKSFLPLIIISLSFCQTIAAPRSRQQARQIASQLLEQPKAVSVGTSLYIYNNEEKPGFAIVSNSDLTRPVIGYSETGTIDPNNMPENLRNWLLWVDQATQWLEIHPECQLTESQMAATQPILPLLGNIAWGQGAPFNNLCPNGSPVGCVATATAQCAYYHRYPTTGVGSHTNENNKNQTVNYDATTYNYDLMFDHYVRSASYTDAQLNEVAKLSYHCGVMSDMKYGTEQSGTTMIQLRRGLVENFNYDPYCELIYRASHSYEEWQYYLQSELSASRPVIFAGNCNNGTEGHCFVIDGVNNEGLYHVNWGWDGSYNGYYDIAVLNPEGVSTGASISDDGFCTDQSILIQLAPKGKLSNPVYYTSISAPTGVFSIANTSVALGGSTTFTITNAYNYSKTAIKGKFGLAFVQNGAIVSSVPYNYNATEVGGMSGSSVYGGTYKDMSITLPKTLESGTYQVYPCFLPTSGTFDGECGLIYSKATAPSYYTCNISNGRASFSKGSATAYLTVSDWSFDSSPLSTGASQTITCSLLNNDEENTLVGKYYLYLTSPSNQKEYVEADNVLTLAPNASGKLSFNYTFKESGQWKSQLYIFYQNIDYNTTNQKKALSGTNKTFEVSYNPTTGANFTLLATPTVVNDPYRKDSLFIGYPASFDIQLKNEGEAYSGMFQMQVYKTTSSTAVMGTVTGQISIPAQSEGTYTFTGNLEKTSTSFTPAAKGSIFYARPFFLFGDTYKTFTNATNVANRIKIKVFAGSPATGIEAVESEYFNNGVCLDLFGRRSSIDKGGLMIKNGKIILQK